MAFFKLDKITNKNIIDAFDYIDKNGVPTHNKQTDYQVVYDGKNYPIKYLLAVANSFQNGGEINIESISFNRARDVLMEKGFMINPTTGFC